MKKINVLITGLGGGSHGMQILKALRMASNPYFLVGTDLSASSFGLSIVDKSYVLPPAGHSEYMEKLLDIVRENKIQVLFHGSEAELKVISANRDVLEHEGILLPINSHDLIEMCMNKYETMNFLQETSFCVPKFWMVSCREDLDKISIYPLVCKPHIGGGGSNNVFVVQDQEELNMISQYLLKNYDSFLVQEYIGKITSEYTVGVLCDLNGDLIGSIGLRRNLMSALSSKIRVKNRTSRSDLGEFLIISSGISQGEVGCFKHVTKYCEEVAKKLKVRGPINFQCRVSEDKVYIFEINPRFSGTTSIRAMVGFNEPDILIRKHLLDEAINNVSYKDGVVLRALEERLVE